MSLKSNNLWLFGKYKDLALLYIPVWIIWIVSFLLPKTILQNDLPLYFWVMIILGIDVSHVWSTIFRTYLDNDERKKHRKTLFLAPVFAFLVLFVLARGYEEYFWRVLAYFAVFHFMKQQYGFLTLYTRKAKKKYTHRFFKDKWVLYLGMLYPIIFWHFSERNFEWFVVDDFYYMAVFKPIFRILLESFYWIVFLGWILEEFYIVVLKKTTFLIGRFLWVVTTFLNWYIGIVWFNSDLVFTLTNVVAHGVPYIGLIIFYQLKKERYQVSQVKAKIFIFTVILGSVVLAFTEEYFWDMLLNREKKNFFTLVFTYPIEALEKPVFKSLALALLTLPQVTHYLLDGFIWKKDKNDFKKIQ